MTEEIIIAGFGGQGVLSMGKILAYSGIMQDQEVSWMPSYGPEMRGGTANVTVIISDERISSPVLNAFDSAIVLNQQSMDNLEKGLKKSLPARHHNLIPMNIEAVQTGMAELKTIHQL